MAFLGAYARLGILKARPTAAAGDMRISRNADRPGGAGPEKYFTGEVVMKPLFGPAGSSNMFGGQMTFTACARTLWHSHPAGQTLIVISGSGWVQEWGAAKQEVNPGDVIWTPPGIKHWHGATTSGEMTHIAIQEAVDGSFINCMEKVSDEQYLG
ncbi:(R)-mandelonitrile lyase [Mycobacterium simiae]|nr:cupin domain-containing protein [Mycobacterium simiae]